MTDIFATKYTEKDPARQRIEVLFEMVRIIMISNCSGELYEPVLRYIKYCSTFHIHMYIIQTSQR